MIKKEIKLIGFDLDNTLYKSNEEMQKRIRGKIYEKLANLFGISLEESESLFEYNYNGEYPWRNSGSRTIDELGRAFGIEVDGKTIVQESIEEADIIDFIEENKKLEEMLIRIRKKYPLDIITSGAYEFALKKLNKIGIKKELFDLILAEGKFGSKTTGDVYKYWINERKIDPSEILYVGDNLRADIEVPKLIGMNTCLVGRQSEMADICINDILELEKHLINDKENKTLKVPVKIKKLHPDAKIPLVGSEHAAGFDIYSCENYELEAGETHAVASGIALEIPHGKVLFIWDRSGMGFKGIHRFAGVIDSDYRGELKIVLHNSTKNKFKISNGDRIAQGVIQDYYKPIFEEVEELSDTSRGSGGFGSTGV